MEVRPIARDDIRAAIALLIGGSLTPQFERPECPDEYWLAVVETRRQRGDVLVAEHEGEVVGVCQVIVFQHFQHAGGWCAELESVHVRSDMRGQGIGAQLLAGAEEFARTRDCYRVQLTSRNVRGDAHRFYLANGYGQTSQGFKKFLS
ncbi:MAG TPA: GNAT family N-acetyltransferase [Acidimicrobiales bacterium]